MFFQQLFLGTLIKKVGIFRDTQIFHYTLIEKHKYVCVQCAYNVSVYLFSPFQSSSFLNAIMYLRLITNAVFGQQEIVVIF